MSFPQKVTLALPFQSGTIISTLTVLKRIVCSDGSGFVERRSEFGVFVTPLLSYVDRAV